MPDRRLAGKSAQWLAPPEQQRQRKAKPPDVWAPFLLHHADGGSHNCRKQALALRVVCAGYGRYLLQESTPDTLASSRSPESSTGGRLDALWSLCLGGDWNLLTVAEGFRGNY